mmetsp:Transcript_25227/g.74159  ORF Transcript_25227/g.74159 Transcript_25227/m.74159 type:complete len:259 (-) Transcript_25227:1716-2492(-)
MTIVLHHPDLEIFAEIVPELNVSDALLLLLLLLFVPPLGDVADHVEGFSDEALVDDAEHLGLLKDLAGDVEGKIVRIDHAPDELEPPGHDIVERVVDEDPLDVQANVPGVLVEHILGQLEREHAGYVQYRSAFDLPLHEEVGELLRIVVAGAEGSLVKFSIFLLGHLPRTAQPDGLGVLHDLEPLARLWHGLHLGLLPLLQVGVRLDVRDLLVFRSLLPYRDGEFDELGISLEELVQLGKFSVLEGVVLEMQDYARPG